MLSRKLRARASLTARVYVACAAGLIIKLPRRTIDIDRLNVTRVGFCSRALCLKALCVHLGELA